MPKSSLLKSARRHLKREKSDDSIPLVEVMQNIPECPTNAIDPVARLQNATVCKAVREKADARSNEELIASLHEAVMEEEAPLPNVKEEPQDEVPALTCKRSRGSGNPMAIIKKLLDECSSQRVQEVLTLQRQRLVEIDAAVAEAAALEEARVEQVRCAQKELEAATSCVKDALDEETFAFEQVGNLTAHQSEARRQRNNLREARDFLKLATSLAPAVRGMKEAKEQRRASAAAAAAARQKHKELLSQTKRAMKELGCAKSQACGSFKGLLPRVAVLEVKTQAPGTPARQTPPRRPWKAGGLKVSQPVTPIKESQDSSRQPPPPPPAGDVPDATQPADELTLVSSTLSERSNVGDCQGVEARTPATASAARHSKRARPGDETFGPTQRPAPTTFAASHAEPVQLDSGSLAATSPDAIPTARHAGSNNRTATQASARTLGRAFPDSAGHIATHKQFTTMESPKPPAGGGVAAWLDDTDVQSSALKLRRTGSLTTQEASAPTKQKMAEPAARMSAKPMISLLMDSVM